METVQLSTSFRRQATKAIASIAFFVVTYLVLIASAVALTAICVYAGMALILFKVTWITIVLGLGLSSFGLLVLVFLLKFAFQTQKVDRSHLIEVTEAEEPALFQMIREIVIDVKTSFPKRVYLSSQVNASVFYNSSFWSMFLPIRKNLEIGIGLVNSLTTAELKAVLSHEFGHFSQRSMKVGSYVYNVNQVIHNLLFQNDGYQEMLERWAGMNGYFLFFVGMALKVVGGIQWILRQLYVVVNKSYLALSREMEFHADEIAAAVTGPAPLQFALLRLNMADQALSSVFGFYDSRKKQNLRSTNIFQEQSVVLKLLAERNRIPVVGHLPRVTLEAFTQFNKSKLVLKNQWASHPTTEERVERLEKLTRAEKKGHDTPAGNLFSDFGATQRVITDHVFAPLIYTTPAVAYPTEQFRESVTQDFQKNALPTIYNGYYDHKNPVAFATDDENTGQELNPDELFSRPHIDLIYQSIALQMDIGSLRQIAMGFYPIKTFDYDGQKYEVTQSNDLIGRLEKELEMVTGKEKEHDKRIYGFFLNCERAQNSDKLGAWYSRMSQLERVVAEDGAIAGQLAASLQFTQVTTPVETINENFFSLKPIEKDLKGRIRNTLASGKFESVLTPEMRESFEKYISQDLEYFGVQTYIDKNLEILYAAVNNYDLLLGEGLFRLKKEILTYQEQLLKGMPVKDLGHP